RGADIGFVDVSPDGRWVVTNQYGVPVLQVWDGRTGQPVKQLVGECGWGTVRFSPDGRWLATPLDNGRLWQVGPSIADWSEGRRPGDFHGACDFSPDSRLLALGPSTGTIRVLDPERNRELARLEIPENHIPLRLTFTPDGTRLIATHVSGADVWDLRRIRQ